MIFGSTDGEKCSQIFKFCNSSVFTVISDNLMSNLADYIIGQHQKKKSIQVVEREREREKLP